MTLRRWDAVRLLLALAGVGVMAYLTAVHYSAGARVACPSGGAVNCETVLSSVQSRVLGVPLSVLGLAWFGVAAALAAAALRLAGREPSGLSLASLAWTASGAVMVLYLVYVELGMLGAICLWCTAGHVLIASLLVLQVLTQPLRE